MYNGVNNLSVTSVFKQPLRGVSKKISWKFKGWINIDLKYKDPF